jgi:gas vesicle protein
MYERRGGSVFGAFLLGGLVGAVLGLLFAPRSGAETREMLSERANDYWGQAGEMYATGMDKVSGAVDSGKVTATEKSEQLREKIDEARTRLQEQVAKSAESAKGKIADVTPAAKDAVDKAAEGTKSGLDVAASKAHSGLDYVAKKATPASPEDVAVEAADSVEAVKDTVPEV